MSHDPGLGRKVKGSTLFSLAQGAKEPAPTNHAPHEKRSDARNHALRAEVRENPKYPKKILALGFPKSKLRDNSKQLLKGENLARIGKLHGIEIGTVPCKLNGETSHGD